MRYAVIMAGGSGTRLWPMSRADQPKQLIPFIRGRSLLQLASDRLEGLLPSAQRYVCAGQAHRAAILAALPDLPAENYLAEPAARDTLNAVGFPAAVLAARDPEAVVAVFTADHLIEPVDQFQRIVAQGFALAEENPQALVTFGITPTHPATAYGYVELGPALSETAFQVAEFREKPQLPQATEFFQAGPQRYLWNSGMFVWRARTLLECIRHYRPENYEGLQRLAAAWDTPRRQAVMEEVYPRLPKISVDYAVMQPASRDPEVTVATLPMPLSWLDVGSWPAFAQTCPRDPADNALGAGRHLLMDSQGNLLVSSDPEHLIAAVGCEDLIVVHTPRATLICRADQAERIKDLHQQVGEQHGQAYL